MAPVANSATEAPTPRLPSPIGDDSGRGLSWLDAAIAVLLIGITLWRLLPEVSRTEFHRDEARWLHNTTLLREWKHPLGIDWQDEGYVDRYGTIDEKNRRRSQPAFAMYVLGLGVYLQLGHLPENGYWIMSKDTAWNTAEGNMPTSAELRSGRRTDVAIAALTVLALYAIGSLLTNRTGGTATALIYALHPLVENTDTRAWSDPLLGLMIALAALAGYWLAAKPAWVRAAVLGVALGLGGATKLSPLGVAAVAGVVGVLLLGWGLIRRRDRTSTRLGSRLLAVPAFAFVTFVAVYPYLWTDPIEHTRRMFDFRAESFELQAQSFPAAKVEDRADAFRRIGDELGDRFSIGGMIAEEFNDLLGTGEPAWPRGLDLGLAVAGWLIIAGLMISRGGSWSPGLMVGIIAVQAGAVIFGMGVEYARYLLPVLLAVAVGAGAAIGVTWEIVRSRFDRRSPDEELGDFSPSFEIAESL